ncbi:MAG: hypothetical protein DRN31_00155 [Thermoplasmata archaeon]|nr:MAG: hypothetical protein DRN31_00155 [Thermoplasmata archaeon]
MPKFVKIINIVFLIYGRKERMRRNEERRKKMEEHEELALLEKFQEDSQWMAKKYKELQEKYEGKFVAIIDKEVVGVNEDVENLIKEIKDKLNEDELGRAIMEYIPPKDLILIL